MDEIDSTQADVETTMMAIISTSATMVRIKLILLFFPKRGFLKNALSLSFTVTPPVYYSNSKMRTG